ncbi:hypothetical protein K443DRAFT_581108 [Laccaria amethystina LaAM-08-1]|uniref:Uncharacterized protein n=1 Tax=Laccaria amethystina LaAM-08-1 TaxID=1095629 RepID=A0A0C9WRB2_9AGAR|nr:hypothetical protein K443DRAFT_581108 [Laccaria amethystina LaAM-08-1]
MTLRAALGPPGLTTLQDLLQHEKDRLLTTEYTSWAPFDADPDRLSIADISSPTTWHVVEAMEIKSALVS